MAQRVSGLAITGKLMILLFCVLVSACKDEEAIRAAESMTGGNVERGKQAITKYACQSCHIIPGIRDAKALVGPPLTHMASRMYIAGVLKNTPENMQKWLLNPPAVDQLTAMPHMGVTDTDARDIASYLYTLK